MVSVPGLGFLVPSSSFLASGALPAKVWMMCWGARPAWPALFGPRLHGAFLIHSWPHSLHTVPMHAVREALFWISSAVFLLFTKCVCLLFTFLPALGALHHWLPDFEPCIIQCHSLQTHTHTPTPSLSALGPLPHRCNTWFTWCTSADKPSPTVLCPSFVPFQLCQHVPQSVGHGSQVPNPRTYF